MDCEVFPFATCCGGIRSVPDDVIVFGGDDVIGADVGLACG